MIDRTECFMMSALQIGTGTIKLDDNPLAVEFVPTNVIVDPKMPGMSGYEFAQHLSQHPPVHNLRSVALTANSKHPGREFGREARIERYLIKPTRSVDLN
jgi:CheY-like chemotaxis protein